MGRFAAIEIGLERIIKRGCAQSVHSNAQYRFVTATPVGWPTTKESFALKKLLKAHLPGPEIITENRYLGFLKPWLGHPRLWHMHRRAVALGVAIGLITGLIPGPVQILIAVSIAIPLRANVLAAAFATFYTNPITFVPLYLMAYKIGSWITGANAANDVPAPITFSWDRIGELVPDLLRWIASLGDTLLIGLAVQASALALVGYVTTLVLWRVVVSRMWRTRHARRTT
jgi:uncharacterized protein (DUF2062 family)